MSDSTGQVHRSDLSAMGSRGLLGFPSGRDELPIAYSRDVDSHPLLTQAEEGYWAQAFFDSRRRIRAALLGYPSLLLATGLHLLDREGLNHRNYLEPAEERLDLDGIRDFLERWRESLRRDEPFDFRYGIARLGVARIRDLFYEDCLDLALSGGWLPTPAEAGDWDRDKADLRSCWDLMTTARNTLVNGNLRLVLGIARRYNGSQCLSQADLVQEGNIGLLKAIEHFEYQRGRRFSTYATYWIRQAVSDALCRHGRTIRMPFHIIRELRQIRRCEREMLQATGRSPSPEEIAGVLGMSASRIRGLLKMSRQPLSLEYIGDGGEIRDDFGTPGEDGLLAAQRMEDPAGRLGEIVRQALDCLDLRERQIVERHFGLEGREPETHERIARSFRLSSERIRQIEAGALRKLKLHGVF